MSEFLSNTNNIIDLQEKIKIVHGYADFGWKVVLVNWITDNGDCSCHKGRECNSPGKHPLGKWKEDATSDKDRLTSLLTRTPLANIAIATGERSGVYVLDIDCKNKAKGYESLRNLEEKYGPLQLTLMATTGSGGTHYFFMMPNFDLGNRTNLFEGIDVRANNGIAVVYPSNHVSGQNYKWTTKLDTPMVEPPEWLIRLHLEHKNKSNKSNRSSNASGQIKEGHRNDHAIHLAGKMRRSGFGEESICAALLEENKRFSPPLCESEVAEIARSAMRYPPEDDNRDMFESGIKIQNEKPVTIAQELLVKHFTDLEGQLLLRYYQEDFYRYKESKWISVSNDCLRETVYDFYSNAYTYAKDGFTGVHANKNKVGNVIDALKGGGTLIDKDAPCCLNDEKLDYPSNEFLVLVNGLLHPSSRTLIPSSPNFFSIGGAEYDYLPKAPEPTRWIQFMQEMFKGDIESIHTLQEIMGYLVSGDTSYEKIFLLVGQPRSGKGVLAHIISSLIGSSNVVSTYLKRLSEPYGENCLVSKSVALFPDAHLSDRADGSNVAEVLKSISGGDNRSIPRKYKDDIEGHIRSRFVIMGNTTPDISDPSGALASRLITLSMNNSFLGQEDIHLKSKLDDELSGILNWCIDGLDRLRERGHFVQPSEGERVKSLFEKSSSPISAFISECCELNPACQTPKQELFSAFQEWAESGRDHP